MPNLTAQVNKDDPPTIDPASLSDDDKTKEPPSENLAPKLSQIDIPGPTGSEQFGLTVTALPNGNLVIVDPLYDITSPSVISNVGAVYLYDSATGAQISKITGRNTNDMIGNTGITTLTNGNYVIQSGNWDNGAIADAGAATFGNGATGVSGVVSSTNSLVGSTAVDNVGSTVTALSNGNYLVSSLFWDNGAATNAGAVTFGSGTAGVSGVISSANSLVGSNANNQIGNGTLTALTNGNYLVRSPNWSNGAMVNAGAVTFLNATTGVSGVISSANSLVGSSANDIVGNGGITLLNNGNYVVNSPSWSNGGIATVGAVTFGSGTTGVSGSVSSANSLIGSTANDSVGFNTSSNGVTALPNGNYVVSSPFWDNGPVADVGAVTFGNGTTGISGTVSSSNSLVGSTFLDRVGNSGVSALTNGNYVVISGGWDNGATADVGAVTFCIGTTGRTGVVSSANSLVGTTANDQVGTNGVTALLNGNYVVRSLNWDNGAVINVGAVTFGSGTAGVSGNVSSSNSLVGATANDQVGTNGVTELANNNYVVRSSQWDDGAVSNVGAVTFCNGATGRSGFVSSANSLVGTIANDQVGNGQFTVLTNGNYVVSSPSWSNGGINGVGAATFGNGAIGVTGAVSSANSLVGSTANDQVGGVVTALANGNYVVSSTSWRNGTVTSAGAVTFGNGSTGISGTVSSSNSLVGTTASDQVGSNGVTALTNGNYVVSSRLWDNGAVANVGAVTFGNGTTGISGTVSSANSLVGSTINDNVGSGGVTVLLNGNYVVRSSGWDSGPLADVGAISFGNGMLGTSGAVGPANSMVGTTANDNIGNVGVETLANGNYVFRSNLWDNGPVVNAGAITYGAGNGGTVGQIGPSHSVSGTVGGAPVFAYSIDLTNETLVVGKYSENKVSILNPTYNAVASGNWSTASTWNYGAFTKKHDVVIPSPRSVTLDTNIVANSVTINSGATLTLNADRSSASPITNNSVLDISLGKLDMGTSLLTVGCTGVVSGVGTSKYVLGTTRKDFCSPSSFAFPTGTANGYSPVTANLTALAVNPSSLTVNATQSIHPLLFQTNSLKRYWTLTESGDVTANLTFSYLDPTDIIGTESSYRLFRVNNGFMTAISPFSLNTAANTISANGVTDFAEFSVGNIVPLANISGRVLNAEGRGVRNATVTMTNPSNVQQQVLTGPNGVYQFANVPTDVQYSFSVTSRRFTFAPKNIVVLNDYSSLNFVSQ